MFFKRLAVGAADPKFAANFRPWSTSMKGEAARAERPWRREPRRPPKTRLG